ncbi:YibE/F family protein [Tsukamurella serpentis]
MTDTEDRADHEQMGHVHTHSLSNISLGKWAARVVVGLLAVIGIAVVAGVVLLWPSQMRVTLPGAPQSPTLYKGTVTDQQIGDCDFTPRGNGQVIDTEPHPVANPDGGCLNSAVQITSGPDAGKWTQFSIGTLRVNFSSVPGQAPPDQGTGVQTSRPAIPGTGQPNLTPGTKIMIAVNGGGVAGAPSNYSFYDYSRGISLWVWGLIFAVVVVIVAQWRGLRALLGLALSGVVIVLFALPSILDGNSAVWVALVASAVILYVVLYLAHGVSLRTSAALLGTLCSLAVCGVLAWAATETTRVTGLSSDDATNLQAHAAQLSISGVLLAGFVIGALGVLNDVTITQASATFELAKLSPKASRRRTFLSAMRVGRDHIASTVYTLVFAYVGSALPLLLLFSIASRPLGQVLTSDSVSVELVRSFVGGIGLALSVPLTTAIATLLAKPKRAAVSAEAAERYTQSHPDSDPSEIRVRSRRGTVEREEPAPGPSERTAGQATEQVADRSAPAAAAPSTGRMPVRRPQPDAPQRPGRRRLPSGPIPTPPRPAPPAEQPRRGRHSAD